MQLKRITMLVVGWILIIYGMFNVVVGILLQTYPSIFSFVESTPLRIDAFMDGLMLNSLLVGIGFLLRHNAPRKAPIGSHSVDAKTEWLPTSKPSRIAAIMMVIVGGLCLFTGTFNLDLIGIIRCATVLTGFALIVETRKKTY